MSANVEYDVFLEFLQVVRSHIPRNIDSPLIVHCRLVYHMSPYIIRCKASLFGLLSGHLYGKSCSLGLPYVLFVC